MYSCLSLASPTLMADSHPPNFANQDLRNRSFRGRDLKGANFSRTDIRGCNFSRAQLQGANFRQAKMGYTWRKLTWRSLFALIIAWFAFDAMSQMVINAIGISIQDPTWIYTLALQTSSGIAGLATALWSFSQKRNRVERITIAIAGSASAALYSFYYGGVFADKNPKVAIAAAIVGGIVVAIVSFLSRSGWLMIAIAVAGTIAGYGFGFMLGATAIHYLSVSKLLIGGILAIVTLGWLRLTLNSFYLITQTLKHSASTSFRKANLANAQFEGATLPTANFTDVSGQPD
jgi:hypothetical protein